MLIRIAASALLVLFLAEAGRAQEPVTEPAPAVEPEPQQPPGVDEVLQPRPEDQEELDRIEAEIRRAQAEGRGAELTDLEALGLERGGDPRPHPDRAQPGLEEYVSPLFGLRPARIAPGADGVVHLVMMLIRDSVIQPGATLKVKITDRQGPLSFGGWSIDPPRIGELDTHFRGQPCYDNTAIVKIPVRVDPGVDHGKYPMTLDLEIEISEGQSGQVRGIYQASLSTQIEVGDPLPSPALRPAQVAGQGSPGSDPAAEPGGWSPGDAIAVQPTREPSQDEPEAPNGWVVAPGAAAEPANPVAATLLPEEPAGLPWLWIIGGALVIGILVLLLARAGRG